MEVTPRAQHINGCLQIHAQLCSKDHHRLEPAPRAGHPSTLNRSLPGEFMVWGGGGHVFYPVFFFKLVFNLCVLIGMQVYLHYGFRLQIIDIEVSSKSRSSLRSRQLNSQIIFPARFAPVNSKTMMYSYPTLNTYTYNVSINVIYHYYILQMRKDQILQRFTCK